MKVASQIMGDIADRHVDNYTSGRWGVGAAVRARPDYPTTTKEAIADRTFMIVQVLGGKFGPAAVQTNRVPGTKLVVCDNTPSAYWVWTSDGVTGIAKGSCKVLENDLSIKEALKRMNRKAYAPQVAAASIDLNSEADEESAPSEAPARDR